MLNTRKKTFLLKIMSEKQISFENYDCFPNFCLRIISILITYYLILLNEESKLEYKQEMLRKIRKSKSTILTNIATMLYRNLFQNFQNQHIVPGSVPSTNNES